MQAVVAELIGQVDEVVMVVLTCWVARLLF